MLEQLWEHSKKEAGMPGFDLSHPLKNEWTKINKQWPLLKKEEKIIPLPRPIAI